MIKIISDTLSCITPAEAAEMGIPLLPQIVIFEGEQSYRDDHEITHEQFLEKLKAASVLPKTSAPPPALYHPVYQEAIDQDQTLIIILPSEKMSGTLRAATVARQEFPQADVRLFDTQGIGPIQGSMTRIAIDWAKQGMSADEILSGLASLRERQVSYFVVDTLEYLHKNGRIGTAKALIGSVLEIKPILGISEGSIAPVESQRTQKKAIARLKELVMDQYPRSSNGHLTLCHANALPLATSLAEEFAACLQLPAIPIYNLPPAIMVHAGPGAVCAQFFKE
ncbi:MAG: DegV family protein [Anaerolineae bacterium]|nr:DegV family protein [Anaerolineae bacterium]